MSDKPNGKKKICIPFANRGKCLYGDKCQNHHDKSGTGKGAKGKQPTPKPKKASSSAAVSAGLVMPASPASPLDHSRSPTPPDISEKSSLTQDVEDDEDEECNFYPSCAQGDKCKFRHPDKAKPDEKPNQPTAENGQRVCTYFTKGNCKRGSQCFYLHSPNKTKSHPSKAKATAPEEPYRPVSPFGYEDGNESEKASDDPEEERIRTESGYKEDERPYVIPTRKQSNQTPIRSKETKARVKPAAVYEESVLGFEKAPRSEQPASPSQSLPLPVTVPHIAQATFHWSQFADPHTDGNIAFCKQLTQNNCLLQGQCRFRHSLTPEEYVALFKDQQPILMTIAQFARAVPAAVPIPIAPLTLQQPAPPVAPYIPPAPPAPRPPKKCDYYQLGRCRNGSKCPYLHEDPLQADSNSTDVNSTDVNSLDNMRGPSPTRPVCHFYQQNRYCPRGPNCPDSHILSSDIQRYADRSSADYSAQEQPAVDNSGWGATTNDWGNINEDETERERDLSATNNQTQTSSKPVSKRNSRANSNDNWSSNNSNVNRLGGSGVCYDFQEGRCRRGDSCRFSHSDGSNGREGGDWSRRDNRCWRYDSGSCSRGDRCRFSHEGGAVQTNEEAENHEWGASATSNGWGNEGLANEAWGESVVPEKEEEEEQQDPASNFEEGTDPATTLDEVEDVEESPEAVNNDDGSDGWNKDASWTEPTTGVDATPAKKSGLCLAFGQGACTWDNCPFQHVLPADQRQIEVDAVSADVNDEQPEPWVDPSHSDDVVARNDEPVDRPPSPEIVEAHEPVLRLLYNCTVRFGSKCDPEDIMTAADSREVIISNLPVDVTDEEVELLVQKFGSVQTIQPTMTEDAAIMSVRFTDHNEALTAARHLNGQTYSGRTIAARLDSRAQVFARSPLHSHVLMAAWPTASMSAWSYYKSVTGAKQALQRLDGMKYKDRLLKAKIDKGKNSVIPVRITNLPPDVTRDDVHTLNPTVVPVVTTLGEPTYKESPLESVREDLEKFGRVESFDMSEENTVTKTIAYATMETYTAAANAGAALNNSKPKYLGEQTLKVQHIYISHHKIPTKGFEYIASGLDTVRQEYKDKCTIFDYPQFDAHVIQVHAPIDQSSTFAEASGKLEALVGGYTLTSEIGDHVWNDYFESSSGVKAIEKINDADIPSFIYLDQRLQTVRIYGAEDGRDRGKTRVQKVLKSVDGMRHEILVPRSKMAPFLTSGLPALQDPTSLGPNKVAIDVVSSKLIVKGTSEELGKAQLALNVTSVSPAASTVARSKMCPICERVPADPVKLSCRHAYCKACLQIALTMTTNGGRAFFFCIFTEETADRAIGEDTGSILQSSFCGTPISYAVVRDTLQLTTGFEYLKSSFLSFIRSSRDKYFFCPTYDCNAIYRSRDEGIIIRCSMCRCDICPNCCSRSHDGRLCAEPLA